jgi:hypothetical protein
VEKSVSIDGEYLVSGDLPIFQGLLQTLGFSGAPDKIRTCDLCLRRAALYPAELRVHAWIVRRSARNETLLDEPSPAFNGQMPVGAIACAGQNKWNGRRGQVAARALRGAGKKDRAAGLMAASFGSRHPAPDHLAS